MMNQFSVFRRRTGDRYLLVVTEPLKWDAFWGFSRAIAILPEV